FVSYSTVTSSIHTLSLHDALPIWITTKVHFPAEGWVTLRPAESFVPQYSFPVSDTIIAAGVAKPAGDASVMELTRDQGAALIRLDRKSTRLNSSHVKISYAVFCLK